MYAIIKTGSKQYRVKEGDIIDIEKLHSSSAPKVTFDDVLLLGSPEGSVQVGAPMVAGAKVQGEILLELKDKKLVVFKYKRRKNSKCKKGHRQRLSRVKITAIEGGK